MERLLMKVALIVLLTIPIVVVIYQTQDVQYPTDYEQLSEEDRLIIRFSHVVGQDTPKGMAALKFADLVKERSNGYIEIQVFANGTLYKDSEEMKALQNGDIHMIAPAISKVTYLIPPLAIYDLPFAFRNYDEVHQYANSEVGLKLSNQFLKHNLMPLGIWDNGFKQFSNNVRPIESYHNLNELRMRIMPSVILSEQYAVLNAEPKQIEFNDVFTVLENQDIDGHENTLSNISSKNFHSIQNYLTISNHGYLGYYVLLNNNFWKSLSPDIQQLLTDTFYEVQQWEWELAQQLNNAKLDELKQCQCIDIHYLQQDDIPDWEEALQPVYDYYRKKFGDTYIQQLPKFSGPGYSE